MTRSGYCRGARNHGFDRKTRRLRGFDYSRPGAYFITIATYQRRPLFGRIDGTTVALNPAGRVVETTWYSMPGKFPGVEVDAIAVMPEHMHGIVHLGAGGSTLGDIVGAFKSLTTVEYARGVRLLGWEAFPGRLWERNYYEHVVRDREALARIRTYIQNNAAAAGLEQSLSARTGAPTRGAPTGR